MNIDDLQNLKTCIGTGNEAVDLLETLSIDLPYAPDTLKQLEKIINDMHRFMQTIETEHRRLNILRNS